MKRYYRGISKKKVVSEIKKAAKVLGWPESVTCKVCYKKNVPIDEAILRQGINSRKGDYWICSKCLGE
jgi:hypothetical protein